MRWPDAFFGAPWSNHFAHRVLHKLAFAAVLAVAFAASLGGALLRSPSSSQEAHTATAAPPWPVDRDGQPLRPQALGEVEARFARAFPGRIARFTDGREVLVLRTVAQPTRLLHPAADCWRALGYRVARLRLEHDARGRLWRCFHAERAGSAPQRVCERIEDAAGGAFTDTSDWYWAGWSGRSTGPWTAVTRVGPP